MAMKDITSLAHLIEELDGCTAKEAVHLVKYLNLDPAEFSSLSFWSKEHYTRNCVARNEHYELLLLCWEPHQATPVHCHGEQECWVYGVQGNIEEVRYQPRNGKKLEEVSRGKLGKNDLAYMVDEMGYHTLENLDDTRSMTLHLYMDPIEKCRIFDLKTGDYVWKELHYYSLEGQLLETA